MRAILLAAGVGRRLGDFAEDEKGPLPKCLLRFGGRTLLDRHASALAACGVDRLDVVIGYRAADVAAELERVAAIAGIGGGIIENPEFKRGSILSLHCAAEVFATADSLVMDADVLYPTALLSRLVESRHPSCLLLDTRAEPDDEAMRVGADETGRVRTIRRGLRAGHATIGESVGFFKLSPAAGSCLAAALQARVDRGELDSDYENAIDDLFAQEPVGFEPVAPHLWTEIDFAGDAERAAAILSQLEQG